MTTTVNPPCGYGESAYGRATAIHQALRSMTGESESVPWDFHPWPLGACLMGYTAMTGSA